MTKGSDWKALQTVIRIESERHLKAIRSHWEMENKLHWVLDVTFCEDAPGVRSDNGAEMLNMLRKIALNIARLHSPS